MPSATVTTFKQQLTAYFDEFKKAISTDAGDWIVKGFIDVYKNIYTISVDTKVASKVIELMLFPTLSEFCTKNGYEMILCEHQNHYPDITFVARDGTKIALDLKSTYRLDDSTINGFTLGAFTGYFRQRTSSKNVRFPYGQYAAHFVLGIIYTRTDGVIDEKKIHKLENLEEIISVVKNFTFLVQEKWQIASDKPGSGNTKNIGSVKDIDALINGRGTFAEHGEAVFDDYWINFLTSEMARAIDSEIPYKNLRTYLAWKDRV
ncbi:MAG: type II restriction endonuclease [Candidatus Peribacteraceae bacterium]|nr:type II restriction endonuclease [Candidatus Peribacteraceae bacterium]